MEMAGVWRKGRTAFRSLAAESHHKIDLFQRHGLESLRSLIRDIDPRFFHHLNR